MLSSEGQTSLFEERVRHVLNNYFDTHHASSVVNCLNPYTVKHEEDVPFILTHTASLVAELERLHYQFQ